jgi:hypothetical protein
LGIILENDKSLGIMEIFGKYEGQIKMYKIFMLIALPVVAIGWVAYAIWIRWVIKQEKSEPKQESQRLTQTKSEIADWAQKMAKFQPPKYKKTSSDDNSEHDKQDKTDRPV